MSSLDDIFMVSDTEEDEEESTTLSKKSEKSTPIQIKPIQNKIDIPTENEESIKQEPKIISEKNKNYNNNKNTKNEIKQDDIIFTESSQNDLNKPENIQKKKEKKQPKMDKIQPKINKNDQIQNKYESSENSPNFIISDSNESRSKGKPKSRNYSRDNTESDLEFPEGKSQVNYAEQIEKLERMIDEKNRQFEAEFEDLKSRHSEKLAILKQNNLSKEQSLSNSLDLEYRNVIWTTTLHHLKRGCFSENLGLLFQQAINDEQFQLEKELIELKQKNEEEIDYYRSKMPTEKTRRRIRKKRVNDSSISPKAMASMINNKFLCDIDFDEYDFEITKKIDILISKIQKETQYLTMCYTPPSPKQFNMPNPIPKMKITPRRSKSPKKDINDRLLKTLKQHKKACNHLQKSVKKTDKYIKDMQENDWFPNMFPHVE